MQAGQDLAGTLQTGIANYGNRTPYLVRGVLTRKGIYVIDVYI